jgi:hypothetical protein
VNLFIEPRASSHRGIRPWLSGVVLAAWAGLVGCRNSDALPAYQVYEVKGQVLLADGKPLNQGFIFFVPKGDLPVTPSAEIRSDGSFSLVTGGSGEGAPPGDYKIRVEAPQFQQARKKSRKSVPFPFKYTDEDSSGVVVTVRAQDNQLEPILLK